LKGSNGKKKNETYGNKRRDGGGWRINEKEGTVGRGRKKIEREKLEKIVEKSKEIRSHTKEGQEGKTRGVENHENLVSHSGKIGGGRELKEGA